MRSSKVLKSLRAALHAHEGASDSLKGVLRFGQGARVSEVLSNSGAHKAIPYSPGVLTRPFSTGTVAQRFGKGASRPSILKPLVFCTAASAAAFTSAALLDNDSYRRACERYIYRRQETGDLPTWIQQSPRFLQNLYREFWLDLSPQEQVVGSLIAANAAVFLLLRLFPSTYGFMFRNFVHMLPPLPLRKWTLLTSNFAHLNLMHLGFNMLALFSFGREAAVILGAEQFAGFYLSAGLASALASQLGRRRATSGGYSLGASGAVYGCFAMTALTHPDAEVVVIFLPFLPIKIGDALMVTMALDVAGAVLGWRRFDHFGHLGGALFGLFYEAYGQYNLWPFFQALASLLDR